MARAVLFGIPAGVLVMFVLFRWSLTRVDALIARFALFGAALLAVFPQLASWRDRLRDRDRKVERVAQRAVDEAVAHVLSAAVFCMIGTGISVGIANVAPPATDAPEASITPTVLASGALAAIGAYVLLSSIVAINLLWDAYLRAGQAPPGG